MKNNILKKPWFYVLLGFFLIIVSFYLPNKYDAVSMVFGFISIGYSVKYMTYLRFFRLGGDKEVFFFKEYTFPASRRFYVRNEKGNFFLFVGEYTNEEGENATREFWAYPENVVLKENNMIEVSTLDNEQFTFQSNRIASLFIKSIQYYKEIHNEEAGIMKPLA